MEDRVYKKKFYIRNFDVDFNGKLKLEMLLNFLQESAAKHAGQLNLSGQDLLEKNLAWVMSRYHINISHYPEQGETIQVATWPSLIKGIFTLREYEISSSETKVVQATSSWMAVDLQTKKPVRIKETLPSFPLHVHRRINDDFKPLPAVKNTDIESRFPVLKADLDFNRHVNNVVYIQWAVETVPKEIIMDLRPVQIEVNYKNETFYGDWIQSSTQKLGKGENPHYIHQLFRESDDREIARLRTKWNDL
jgi:medium-chain acyl-[acyl-carrier-protein] hydrolase